MKFCRRAVSRTIVALPLAALLAAGLAAHGELANWLQNLDGHGRFEMLFFRVISLPSGPLTVRRLPAESRRTLDELVAKAPTDSALYLMRARADEEQLDFGAADADWQKYAQLAPDKADALGQLADFYHRRLRPLDEVKVLDRAAREPSSRADNLLPPGQQGAWQDFDRIFGVIRLQALPATLSTDEYNAWIERYPREAAVYSRFFSFLLSAKKLPQAEQLIGRYQKAFPEDHVFPLEARATLAYTRGSIDQALALYDRSFQPLWPPDLVHDYFNLLKETHRLREFLSQARAAALARPTDVDAAARLFYYYQQQSNAGEAERALVDYRRRVEQAGALWTGVQLWTLARLFDDTQKYDDAARAYYALYSLRTASPDLQGKALAGIANLLLAAPEQPIHFGSNSLSFLQDIGAMDRYPGFLNGIVSLLLNSQSPADEYAQVQGPAVTYFHRSRAAELVALFDQRFPKSEARSDLHARLLDAYAVYGADDSVLREGRLFLAAFPHAPQRIHVAMLMADCYARQNRVQEELALYDQLLNELAARADRVPLGEGARADAALAPPTGASGEPEGEQAAPQEESEAANEAPEMGGTLGFPVRRGMPALRLPGSSRPEGQPRSPEYSQVLERYISRLVALHRPLAVIELFRHEMDRNPDDPGLYERLAEFLEQNHMDERIEAVYRKAMQQFSDRSWYQKLARWYLTRKSQEQFEVLTRQVINIFSGTDLQDYFQAVVWNGGPVTPQLYLQLNLYAHQRFPNNLSFVRNLLEAYRSKPTYNSPEWLALIRQYWFDDDNLRSAYFVYLSSSGRLDSELQAVRTSYPQAGAGKWRELTEANPAAAQFIAEAELWRSHFESAAPVIKALAEVFPADGDTGRRAANVYRSLAAFHPDDTEIAAGIENTLAKSSPGDRDILVRIGDIYADRDMFSHARPYWNRVPELEPGNPDAYLQAATVFWDYFLYRDTLRLLDGARQHFSNPNLYAYEAGAVYEGERDYAHAVDEYLKGALASGEDSSARRRLLELVTRPVLQQAIDEATMKAASGTAPPANAVSLRAAVLKTLGRRADLEKFLTNLAQGTSSLDQLAQIQPLAEAQGFDDLRVLILERQIALLTDPVEKLQTRLELAHFYESKNHIEQARAAMENIYAANPLLLGVVRSTVDFYWRNKMGDAAIDTLLKAAKAAYPDLGRRFTFEAARKATDTKEYSRARELLAPLLQSQPYDAEYLAAMADTYARDGDDHSLRDFYTAQIQAFRTADLPGEEKTARIAALRRGLIPALSRLKDYSGAVDQYIEIINKFPEDEGLAQEAAAFADHHGQRQKLIAYYTKAATDSPKDFRWPMVLARIQTYFEDYSGAIASYGKARAIRPDRVDLLTAQAGLEERLMQFDTATRSYERLYELTYQSPEWMEKIAELDARQGLNDAAVAALKKALIEGRPEAPGPCFDVASRLNDWNLLEPAQQFAERGVALAGKELLVDSDNAQGMMTYITVLTRLRDYSTAYARLADALAAAQQQKVQPDLNQFLAAMGRVVKEYYTPEETDSFAQFLIQRKEGMATDDFVERLLPLAQSAGLSDLEARWRYEVMMADPGSSQAQAMETRLDELQKQRLRFNEYAAQLEEYWKVFPQRPGKDYLLEKAADNYAAAGNTSAELNVLQQAFDRQGLNTQHLQRYLELVAATSPERLVAISGDGRGKPARDAAATSALATGNVDLALRAITARGQGLPPVWTRAYTGLVGLYYTDASPEVNSAYQQALDTRNIGERVSQPPNRDETLAGDIWFYYGSRYGEYLSVTGQGNPEDYLPAMLEGAPASSNAYFTLADYFRDAGQYGAAMGDYRHALELSPQRGDAHDRMAQILWQQGKQEAATQEWSLALKAFYAQENANSVPPTFWTDLGVTLENIGQRKLLPRLKDDADRVLRTYIRRNGSYRADPILQGALAAAGDPAKGAEWLVELSTAAESPIDFLSNLVFARWFPEDQKGPVYQKISALAQDQANKTFGDEHTNAIATLTDWRVRWVNFLLDNHRTAEAQAVLEQLPEKYRDASQPEGASLLIPLAVQSNKLDELLQGFRQDPAKAPPIEVVRNVAGVLGRTDPADSRRLLEYVYTREIDEHNFIPADFLGLAEIRLQQGNVPDAVALLQRMNRVAGEPFENPSNAGDLLVKMGHPAEAAKFYALRAKAVPWDGGARLALAKADIAANSAADQAVPLLSGVAASSAVAYSTRAAAAETLEQAKAQPSGLGSAELDLLAKGGPWPAAAANSFYYARIRAAQEARDAATQVRLLLDAIAIRPDDTTPAGSMPADTTRQTEWESPRILLFQAAIRAGQDQLALSALAPLVDPSVWTNSLPAPPENQPAADDNGQPERSYLEAQFFAGQHLSLDQQWQIATQMAQAFEKLGRLDEAARMWNVAGLLAPDDSRRAQAKSERKRLDARIKIEREDQARRPVITDHLQQPELVRPRLSGNSGLAAGGQAAGGVGQ